MATVTGLTAARMIEMENATVVDGDIVVNNLILKTRDGTTIDAGNVRGPIGLPGINGSGYIICTSTTRPTLVIADEGKAIYETDTDLVRVWTGTRWKTQERIICTSTTRPTGLSSVDEGIQIYETDTDLERTWTGSRWKVQERIICTNATRPTLVSADVGTAIHETDTDNEYTWDGSAWDFSSPIGKQIIYGASPGMDRTQGLAILIQLNFTLAHTRLMKVEGQVSYLQISGSSNASTYCNVGFDAGRQAAMGIDNSLPISQSAMGSSAYYSTLSAGSHTAELHVINNSTVGAMRIAIGAGGAWLSVLDMGL